MLGTPASTVAMLKLARFAVGGPGVVHKTGLMAPFMMDYHDESQ